MDTLRHGQKGNLHIKQQIADRVAEAEVSRHLHGPNFARYHHNRQCVLLF